jgi:hypothetical protein
MWIKNLKLMDKLIKLTFKITKDVRHGRIFGKIYEETYSNKENH